MFRVGIVTQFEAAHRLQGDFGPATRTHGHTYRVEVAVAGRTLRPDGTLCDIGRLQQIVQDAIDPLHYRDLDEIEPFTEKNSTAEQVAAHLFTQIASGLAGAGVSTLTVQVWESPGAFAAFEGPLEQTDRPPDESSSA